MKFKLSALIVLTGLLVNPASAQELFKVLASKGDNKVAENGGGKWSAVLIGKELDNKDRIRVAENGYLGMVHSSGKTIELKNPGEYDVSQLTAEVDAQNEQVGKKYMDFVVGEMTSEEEDMGTNRYKYMKVTGSVERGEIDAIDLFYNPETPIMARNVKQTFTWTPLFEDIDGYTVKIKNLFDETIDSLHTDMPSVTIDFRDYPTFKHDEVYQIMVIPDNYEKGIEKFAVVYYNDENASQVQEELTALRKELSEENALSNLLLASFFEDKKLLIEAKSHYEKAVSMEPEVDDYQNIYYDFLVRNKLATLKKSE